MIEFDSKPERHLITGPSGHLEVMTLAPAHAKKAIAFICHPHPLYQGTMDNKVVYTLAKAFDSLGVKTVRFNYRGVGKSEGCYGEGVGEIDDLQAVIDFFMTAYPDHVIYLAGFSFGTYVASMVCNQRPEVRALLTVAPSVEHFDFHPFDAIACPWLVVQGDEDEIVSPPAVFDFAKENQARLDLVKVDHCGHFFHGRLTELRRIITDYFGHLID